jgi:hypothetical protein
MVYIARLELEDVFYEFTSREYLADDDNLGFDFTNESYIKGEKERAFVSLINDEIKLNLLSTQKSIYHYQQYNIPNKELVIDGKGLYLAIHNRYEKEYVGTDLVVTQWYIVFVMLEVEDDYDEDKLKLMYNGDSYDSIEKKYIDDKVVYIYDFIMRDQGINTSEFIEMLSKENFIVDKK